MAGREIDRVGKHLYSDQVRTGYTPPERHWMTHALAVDEGDPALRPVDIGHHRQWRPQIDGLRPGCRAESGQSSGARRAHERRVDPAGTWLLVGTSRCCRTGAGRLHQCHWCRLSDPACGENVTWTATLAPISGSANVERRIESSTVLQLLEHGLTRLNEGPPRYAAMGLVLRCS